MNKNINYNIVPLDATNGLKDLAISSSKNYIILLDAPAGAAVTIKLNSQNADEIPLSENFAIEAQGVQNIYVSCNAVAGQILIGTAATAEEFKIITAPQVKEIDTINYIADSFAPNNAAQVTINAGANFPLDVTSLRNIRFIATDEIGVDLLSNGVKYPMLEDLINTRQLTGNITFYNDTATAVTFTYWSA